MLETEARINGFLFQYCKMLVTDIPEERMAEQPLPGVNHPAWILGHLANTADSALGLMGADKLLPADWATRYGPGSKLSSTRGDYPSNEELLGAVECGYVLIGEKTAVATPEQLAKPTTNPRMKAALPTIHDVIGFILTGHYGVHLGQLSTWRRMIGLPPLF